MNHFFMYRIIRSFVENGIAKWANRRRMAWRCCTLGYFCFLGSTYHWYSCTHGRVVSLPSYTQVTLVSSYSAVIYSISLKLMALCANSHVRFLLQFTRKIFPAIFICYCNSCLFQNIKLYMCKRVERASMLVLYYFNNLL